METLKSKLPLIVRTLLGLVFFVFGLNGFLHFLPQPPLPGRAGEFIGALIGTGYLFTLVKAVEVSAGALLLAGRFVPLAITLLAPIVVNIVMFHLVLAPGGYPMLAFLVGAELFLAWSYRTSFAPMLRGDAKPVLAEVKRASVTVAAE